MRVLEEGNLKFNGKPTGKLIKFTCDRCGCVFECHKSETIVTKSYTPKTENRYNVCGGDEVVGYRCTTTHSYRCPSCNNQVDK